MQGVPQATSSSEKASPGAAIERLLRSASAGSKTITRVEQKVTNARNALTKRLTQLIEGIEALQVSDFEGIAVGDFLGRSAVDDVVVSVHIRGDELAACCVFSANLLSRVTDIVFGGVGELSDNATGSDADEPAPFAGAAEQGVAEAISRQVICELMTAIRGHCAEFTADSAASSVSPVAEASRKLAHADGVCMKVIWRTASQSFQVRMFLAEDVCGGDGENKPRKNDPTQSLSMLNKLRKTQLKLEILLGQTELSLAELSALKTGDVMALDLWLGDEVSVACEAMPLMWANFDQERDQFVLRVTRFVDRSMEADS